MLQRNTSGYVLTVPGVGEFGPGDEVDHEHPICGFTPVDEPKPKQSKTAAKADDKDKEQGK